ncbi:DUF6308 family protein [Micromonospora sp. IBSANI012]|uniref:DUF6308 family protein n=1 Tax=Micromonospora sp. IBSANI012 TaxID=3457761 RepID=UPI004059097D
MAPIIVAGVPEPDPAKRIIDYVTTRGTGETVRAYDLGGQGDAFILTAEEVTRTTKMNSRISESERDWFVRRAAACGPLWRTVPPDARLADADPSVRGGLYDDMLALFDYFDSAGEPGIGYGKISKVLHLKRPNLYPILDSKLRDAYREAAAAAADRYQQHRPGVRWSFWTTVRDDVLNPANVEALKAVRTKMHAHENELVRRAAGLSDVRLLDILAWRR